MDACREGTASAKKHRTLDREKSEKRNGSARISRGVPPTTSYSSESIAALTEAVHRQTRCACPGFLRESAEDIAQATLMRLVARIRDGEVLGRAYVRRAVANAIRDAVRAHDRRKQLHAQHDEVQVKADERAVEADPLAKAALREMISVLDTCRRNLMASYLAGCTMPEAAASLGWSPKIASNTLFRTLKRLRRDLAAGRWDVL